MANNSKTKYRPGSAGSFVAHGHAGSDTPDNPSNRDIYARVNERLIEMLESGVGICQELWDRGGGLRWPKRWNGIRYSGINVLTLAIQAMDRGYETATWMTYKQAQELGGQVRKGARSALAIYADKAKRKDTDGDGNEVDREFWFHKGYNVFPVPEIDGLDASFYAIPKKPRLMDLPERIKSVDTFIRNTGIEVEYHGNRAFYRPSTRKIVMPDEIRFASRGDEVAVLGHEAVHAAGDEGRAGGADFKKYAVELTARSAEEVTAEIGSAFLCAIWEITPYVRPDHAGYVQSWLAVVKNDKRYFVRGAAQAQRRVDWMIDQQPNRPEPQNHTAENTLDC